ncbi:MAG TPA: diguanylate cyclase [Actinomycetota bacterium]|jgi:diguanylate cyclase (GGDEF)-like protein|nr:diguanylate cyclase [Actinomycetota bacterium]
MLRGAAVAVVVLGTMVSALVAHGWQQTIDRQRDDRLDRSANSRKATIEGAMANYENALLAARSLWVASDSVNRREFNAFARSLDLGKRYPGLQGIGWRSHVTDGRRAAFLAQARADGEHGFSIRPPGRRPVYYVTLYSYPRIPSSSTLGADARVVPGDRATLDQARDSGQATLSNHTTLAGDLDLPARERPVAFELSVPVYGHELRPDASVAERRQTLTGWATGQFRVRDFLDAAMRPWRSQTSMGVELYDEASPDDGPLASWPAGFRARGPDVRRDRFSFGGRTFALRFAPLPGSPVLTERNMPPLVVFVVGAALSVLFGVMLWLLAQVGALYREVRRLARTDSLTGVPNRRAWDEELPRELARAGRSGQPVCVALLDLDHFKDYNDRHGHQAGDRFLKEAAAAWQAAVRKTDLVARYGGEEFAILLPDCGLDDAMEIAGRLRTAQPEGTCSLGVARWDGREDVNALIARADRALYAAKEAGRDRIHADVPAAAGSAAWTPAS